MPPKTKKKTKKGKAIKGGKCNCSSQIQNTKVTIGGGGQGGGGRQSLTQRMSLPPSQMQIIMPYETGGGFALEKFEENSYNTHGVNASQENYSSNAPQAHSDMSLLEKIFS